MNSETISNVQVSSLTIDESYFFKAELFLWSFYSVCFIAYSSGLSVRFNFLEVLLQLSVILLAVYGSIVPFIKTKYNLEDLSSAIINISGIVLLTTGATASYIYQMPWGENVFMAGFFCTCYYHMGSPFRERTYQNTNNVEDRLIWLFVIGCLMSFPACFMHEDLFPYPSAILLYAAALGFWVLCYTFLSFCWQWYNKNVRNYMILSYIPRILIMLYFAKGYQQFVVLGSFIGNWQ